MTHTTEYLTSLCSAANSKINSDYDWKRYIKEQASEEFVMAYTNGLIKPYSPEPFHLPHLFIVKEATK